MNKMIFVGLGATDSGEELTKIVNEKIETIAFNTNMVTVNWDNYKDIDKNILIGENLCGGFGTGVNPSKGYDSALESIDKIKEVLAESDFVIIVTCLGGGTGTGATPLIVKTAKEMGIKFDCITTIPFAFEGGKRIDIANRGLLEISKYIVSPTVLSYEMVESKYPKDYNTSDLYKECSKLVAGYINCYLEVLKEGINYKAVYYEAKDRFTKKYEVDSKFIFKFAIK